MGLWDAERIAIVVVVVGRKIIFLYLIHGQREMLFYEDLLTGTTSWLGTVTR